MYSDDVVEEGFGVFIDVVDDLLLWFDVDDWVFLSDGVFCVIYDVVNVCCEYCILVVVEYFYFSEC